MKDENGFWYCLNCREEKLPEIINICDNCGHPIEWIVTHPPQTDECRWKSDGEGNYSTSCDNIFILLHGDATENNMTFCPYCGDKLIEQALNKKG